MKVMQIQVETGRKLVDMAGHNGDVAALSLKPSDKNIFVTGSVDRTARLWDLRIPGKPPDMEILFCVSILQSYRLKDCQRNFEFCVSIL